MTGWLAGLLVLTAAAGRQLSFLVGPGGEIREG